MIPSDRLPYIPSTVYALTFVAILGYPLSIDVLMTSRFPNPIARIYLRLSQSLTYTGVLRAHDVILSLLRQ
jgi:hypothetical protein